MHLLFVSKIKISVKKKKTSFDAIVRNVPFLTSCSTNGDQEFYLTSKSKITGT